MISIFPVRLVAVVLVLGSVALSRAMAEPVAWNPATGIQGDADLSSAGTPVDAVRGFVGRDVAGGGGVASADLTVGDTTFHGIRVVPDAPTTYGDGTISITTAAMTEFYSGKVLAAPDAKSFMNALPTSATASPTYCALVSNGIFYQGLAVGSLTFAHLTPGHLYQVQIWGFRQSGYPHFRANFIDALGNIGTVDAGAFLPSRGSLTPGQSYGQFITGVFLAKDATASIDWCGGHGNTKPSISAMALRDVTGVPKMKETVAAIKPPGPIGPIHNANGTDEWDDLTYMRIGNHSVKLDIIVPTNAPKPVPLVIYLHGGGWGWLDKTWGFANWLPSHGFAIACVDYRLSGEAAWPAQIYDCKAAVRWLRTHASEYGCDGTKIGALGDSAGGHLVSMLGLTNDNPEFEGDEGTSGVSSSIQGVADYFGPSDLAKFGSGGNPKELIQLLGGTTFDLEKARKASPLTYVTAKAPPFVIVHGNADKSVPIEQSIELNDALVKAGVDSKIYVMKGKGHGGNEGPAMDLVVAMFNKALH